MAPTPKEHSIHRGAPRIFVSRRIILIAAFAFVWLSVGALMGLIVRGTKAERGMAALVRVYRDRRPLEPRLTGGFACGVFEPASDPALEDVSNDDRHTAFELLADAAAERQDGYAQLAYGRFLLTERRAKDANRYLRIAVSLMPGSAEAHNDLAACLLEQNKSEDALAELGRALELDSKLPEPPFNRALCYQRLLLTDAASEAFTALLKTDQDPGWRSELLQRRGTLRGNIAPPKTQKEIVAAFDKAIENNEFDEARTITSENLEVINKHVTENVPSEYLKASIAGDSGKAHRALLEIEFGGKQFLAATGDTSTSDLAIYLSRLPEAQHPSELTLLAEYRRAQRALVDGAYGEALSGSRRAEEQFTARGNLVYEALAGHIVASSLYGSGELNRSAEKLREAVNFVETQSWPYTRVQLLSLLGVTYSRLGSDSLGLRYCQEALRFGSGLTQLEAKACQYLSLVYFRMGDLDNRREYLRKSTELYLSGVPSLADLGSNSYELASLYSIRGSHEIALLYANQSLSYARQGDDNSRAAQAASVAAVELAKMGRFNPAEEVLNRALAYVELITSSKQKQFTESGVRRRGGEMKLVQGDVSQALEYFNDAEALARTSEDQLLPLIRVLRARAEAYIRAKQFEEARVDLNNAADRLHQYRNKIEERSGRSDFLDANYSVFDQLIELDAGVLGRGRDAFDVLEESRARALLDEFQSGDGRGKPLPLKGVQEKLPPGLRLLAYSVTTGGTYIFSVTKDTFDVTRTPTTTELLDRLVHDYVQALKTRAPLDLVREKGRELYRYLITPVEDQLGERELLCILPDKALHFLPFAALVDESDKYLITSRRIMYAPSASILVQCINESESKLKGGQESILSVGNPLLNHAAFPDLEDLPDAEREATAVALLYDRRTKLTGSQATKQSVLRALQSSDVVHLAMHCLVEGNAPWLAALVLADPSTRAGRELSPYLESPARRRNSGTRGSEAIDWSASGELDTDSAPTARGGRTSVIDSRGLLYLDDIYKIHSAHTRLVVLSACQTGLGQYFRGEGMVSLVRPFLAMRVPTVVASLWSVESKATADLMIDFHRRRRSRSLGAADALRAAQMAMSESQSMAHPYYWAPFITVGSN